MPDGSSSDVATPATSKSYVQPETFPDFDKVTGGLNPDLEAWLEARRKYNEKAGGLWRIEDKLYDLNAYVNEHPGGADWLEMTRGQDITEAFHAHHPNIKAVKQILAKFYVRDADWPRESPLSFEEDGFYSVLRERVNVILKEKGNGPKNLSKFVGDATALAFIGTSLAAAYKRSVPLALLAGVLGGSLNVMAHNFTHQRNTWRRFYFELTGGSTRSIRIHHCLSHHIYPNASLDVELPLFGSILGMKWHPSEERSTNPMIVDMLKYNAKLLPMGALGALLTPLTWLKKLPKIQNLLPYLLLLAMVGARRKSPLPNSKNWRGILETIGLYLIPAMAVPWWGLSASISRDLGGVSFLVGFGGLTVFRQRVDSVAILQQWGLTVGHYSDKAWRQGETHPKPNEIQDFGLFQLETGGDRIELYAPKTDLMLPVILSTFAEHTLHHLFPSVDHAYHRHLYPVFAQTCNEFGVRFEFVSQVEAIKGFFRELKRTKPLETSRRVNWDGTEEYGWVDEKMGFKRDPRK